MPRLADLEQMAYELFLCCTRMQEYMRICKKICEDSRISESIQLKQYVLSDSK